MARYMERNHGTKKPKTEYNNVSHRCIQNMAVLRNENPGMQNNDLFLYTCICMYARIIECINFVNIQYFTRGGDMLI